MYDQTIKIVFYMFYIYTDNGDGCVLSIEDNNFKVVVYVGYKDLDLNPFSVYCIHFSKCCKYN